MGQFRKKPVVIEAVQYLGLDAIGVQVFAEMPGWLQAATRKMSHLKGSVSAAENGHPWIATLEGGHVASPADWIIRGVQGELYPCKPDIFQATYEPALTREDAA
jgi:hypothetical protein